MHVYERNGMEPTLNDGDLRATIVNLMYDPKQAEEQCGVLLGRRSNDGNIYVDGVVRVPNRAEYKQHDFLIRKGDVTRALKRRGLGLQSVVGAVHTHPPGKVNGPTIRDVESMEPGMLGIVFHIATRTLTYYTHEDGFIRQETI